MISELNKELMATKDELKETTHNNQVMEKRLLKTQEDYDMIKSKFETFKDIEIVNCAIIFPATAIIILPSSRSCENRRKTRELRTRRRSGNCARGEWNC